MAVLLGSTALKFSFVEHVRDTPRKLDQYQYLVGSRAIYKTGVPEYHLKAWDEVHSSPAYPYGLAALRHYENGKRFRGNAFKVQAVLSGLTALLVFLMARRLFGPWNGLISAALVGFLPTFIVYSHVFMTETLYTFLLVSVLAVFLLGRKRDGGVERPVGWKRCLFAGVMGGATALTKSQFVVLSPLVVIWIVIQGRASLRRAALGAAAFVMGIGLVVAPWSVHNSTKFGHFILIDSNPGNVLYKNWNVLSPENHDVGFKGQWNTDEENYSGKVPMRPRTEEENPALRNSTEVRRAIAFVLAEPGIFLSNSWTRTLALFNPTSLYVRSVREGLYDQMPKSWRESLVWVTLLSTMFVLVFSVLGATWRRPSTAELLPLLVLLGCAGLCVLIISTSRYRFPMMPLLIPFAIEGARRTPSIASERPKGLLLAAPVLVVMVYAFIRYVPLSL